MSKYSRIEESQPSTTTSTIPLLPGLPLLGNVDQFRRDAAGTLFRAWRTSGDAFEVRFGPQRIQFFSHPDYAQDILVRGMRTFLRPREFNGGTLLALALGDSVLTTDGDSWLAKRRLMQPVFHRQRITGMGDTMVAAGQRMLARWDKAGTGAETDLVHEMKLVTLDIINSTMFSSDVLGDVDLVGDKVDQTLEFLASYARAPLRIPLSWPTAANRKFKHAKDTIGDYLGVLIHKRRASAERKDDLLDMLLEARDEDSGEGMNDTQVRSEIASIYAAGHETTSLALVWTWHALNQHPHILRKLQDEVDTVLAGRAPTMADLPRLPYTLAVFEEAMRLYPPVPFTVRKAYASARVGPYDIQDGMFVGIAIQNIHRHPDFWPNAEVFDPQRFMPENKATLKREAYMPFLIGPHLCIGGNFAMMEGQLLLALIAQRYTVTEVPGQPVEKQVAITMKPKHGLRVTLARREVIS
jgi:cytochrome P450